MKKPEKKISKRQFVKYTLASIGGIACAPITSLFGKNPVSAIANPPEKLWKWSREAMYYTTTPRGLKCLLCPNECTIKEGELGDCHNHLNYNGKLYTIAYGNPCAVHIDPIEKKPLMHFLPESSAFSIATAGCNLACLNCQNWSISQKSPRETRNFDLMPDKVIEAAIESDCESIAYTYSEPITFYEYTYDTAILARNAGIKNVMVSAGYINEEPMRKLARVIDAANIDLKSFKDSIYLKLNAGKLEPVLRTLKILNEEGVWLEITNLIIPGWTDDFDMIREMCDWLYKNGFADNPLHFSRFQPLYKLTQLPPTPLSTLTKAREIALDAGIKYVYIGNIPGTEAENTFCPNCNKILMERRGYRILSNHIINGKCEYCSEPIAGVWE
ncbi:MAG: AmmeMemoRadiSam system radical SAM enzyme [Bacteroidetes bacterium]|nr:AmmeMemoRadiSam system radical SAM enzyme [Bacteroidota bacterium]